MNSYIKSKDIKGVEILSIKDRHHPFPEHFRETFCISLITQGTECIHIGNKNLYTPTNTISIINPFEVHAKPLLDADINLHFHTLYIPQNHMDACARIKNIHFQNHSIFNKKLNTAFLNVLYTLQLDTIRNKFVVLQQFINILAHYRTKTVNCNNYVFNPSWKEVFQFIDTHYKNPIQIMDLAAIVHMDKYNFAKKFKHTSGMSPINYIIMKRVFAAKKEIMTDTKLTELAYKYNFTDISHFSKYFKKFIGLSPKQYQKG